MIMRLFFFKILGLSYSKENDRKKRYIFGKKWGNLFLGGEEHDYD